MNLLRRILKRIFSSVILASVTVVGAPVAFGATVLVALIFLPLPTTIPLPKSVATVQPTVIYDKYGHPIATLAQAETNIPFTDAQVPQVLKEAVISDEDRNFYHENGVDLRGLVRAAVADVRNRAPVQGASTITEQYVKLAYTGSQRTLARKLEDAILASQLAREASKEEILYRYLTIIYLGDGQTGAASAAETFFHVPVQDLDASQAATIAGLIPAPSTRAPEDHLAQAESARELVLREMYQQHYLTAATYQSALAEKLVLAGTPGAPPNATLVYPKPVASATQYPDFVDYVTRWLDQNLPVNVLSEGGLRVQTTMDPTIQNDATAAVAATLDGSAMPLDMALAAVEPQTGFVQAVVGGRFFGNNGPYEKINLALEGCPPGPSATAKVYVTASCSNGSMIGGGGVGRQPGSSWKPFTLATAFEQGIPPSTTYTAPFVYQIPGCVPQPGQPPVACQIHNDEGDSEAGGNLSLADATTLSINTVYAQVAEQVGCPNVAQTAKNLGVQTAYYATPPFFYCASYALGELGVAPLDMASAYGVFADHGQKAAPTPILEIVNAQGRVLVDNIHAKPKTTTALSANVADNVTNVLESVINSGTGTAAALGRPAAGKTGTTSNTADAWFVGYTPTLSTAVWMGDVNSDSASMGSVCGHYLGVGGSCVTVDQVYGGTWPAITWREFMQAALQDVPATAFDAPAPIVTPQEANVLKVTTTTTTRPIEPGPPGSVEPTPPGGPYEYPVTPPVAPPPASSTTTTLLPSTTTTLGSPTTTSTSSTSTSTTSTTTGHGH